MKLLHLFLLSCVIAGNALAMKITIQEDPNTYIDGTRPCKQFTVKKQDLKGLQFFAALKKKNGHKDVIFHYDATNTTPDDIFNALSKITYDDKSNVLDITKFQRDALNPMLKKEYDRGLIEGKNKAWNTRYNEGYYNGRFRGGLMGAGAGILATGLVGTVIFYKKLMDVFSY